MIPLQRTDDGSINTTPLKDSHSSLAQRICYVFKAILSLPSHLYKNVFTTQKDWQKNTEKETDDLSTSMLGDSQIGVLNGYTQLQDVAKRLDSQFLRVLLSQTATIYSQQSNSQPTKVNETYCVSGPSQDVPKTDQVSSRRAPREFTAYPIALKSSGLLFEGAHYVFALVDRSGEQTSLVFYDPKGRSVGDYRTRKTASGHTLEEAIDQIVQEHKVNQFTYSPRMQQHLFDTTNCGVYVAKFFDSYLRRAHTSNSPEEIILSKDMENLMSESTKQMREDLFWQLKALKAMDIIPDSIPSLEIYDSDSEW